MSKEAKMKEAMEAAKANAVEAEGVKEIDEDFDYSNYVDDLAHRIAALDDEKRKELMSIIEPKKEKVGLVRRINNKIRETKITPKTVVKGLAILTAIGGGVAIGTQVAKKGEEKEEFVDYDEPEALPDNNFDDYKSNEDVYETQEETETEVTEF